MARGKPIAWTDRNVAEVRDGHGRLLATVYLYDDPAAECLCVDGVWVVVRRGRAYVLYSHTMDPAWRVDDVVRRMEARGYEVVPVDIDSETDEARKLMDLCDEVRFE